MELIVLNIGLDLGVISPTLFTMMVVMALVTTFMTTPLLRLIYPPEELAKDRAQPEPVAPEGTPDPFTVLMCVSHGQTGSGMVKLGQALAADSATPSRFYALHLIRPTGRASFQLRHPPEPREERQQDAEGALVPLLERARRLALEVSPLSFVSAEPARDICRTAEAKQAALILLGWHKPLFGQTVLGGTVHEVMREANTNVAVLVDRGLEDLRRVLVPFIGSRHDRAALGLARHLVRSVGADVTVLHVKLPDEAQGQRASRLLDEQLFSEASARVRFKVVTHASPEDAVLAETREGYDLVVVGVGAEWGLGDSMFGLQRERIIRDSLTSLLIIRQPEPAAEPAPRVHDEPSQQESGPGPGTPLTLLR